MEEREDLYDIYINLAAVEITVAHAAKEVLVMTKTHKDLAMSLVRVAENEANSDADVIGEIMKKNSELRSSLYLMAKEDNNPSNNQAEMGSVKMNKSKLKEKQLSTNLESFYWNLAIAEGLASA